MEETLGIEASIRGNKIFLHGDKESVTRAEIFIKDLYSINSDGYTINPEDLKHILRAVDNNSAGSSRSKENTSQNGASASLKDYFQSNIPVSSKKNFIVPRSETQKEYIDSIKKYDMVIGIGPAGTGKTYLAMAMAVNALLKKQVSRIILARPAGEAGEKLGFLPGGLYEKGHPYLRPLYDAPFDWMGT